MGNIKMQNISQFHRLLISIYRVHKFQYFAYAKLNQINLIDDSDKIESKMLLDLASFVLTVLISFI